MDFKHSDNSIHSQDRVFFENEGISHPPSALNQHPGESDADFAARTTAIGRQPVRYVAPSPFDAVTQELGDPQLSTVADGWCEVTYPNVTDKKEIWATATCEKSYIPQSSDVPDGFTDVEPPDCGCCTFNGSEWVVDLDALKGMKKANIQIEKKRVRDGGVVVNDVLFDTDLPARMSYAELHRKIDSNPTYTVPHWKASGNVFVSMDATKLSQVEQAGEQLLADVFAWQAAQNSAIDAATTVAEVEAVSTEYVSPGFDLNDK